MKLLSALIFSTAALLASCGGGGYDSATPAPGPTALLIADTTVGTGVTAENGKTLTVNYTGWLYDAAAVNYRGKQFDTSVGKTPFSFTLGVGQVIAGWDQGFAGMKAGGTRTLVIPSALAYGSAGAGSSIPPNAALVFSVDLISVK